MKASSTTGSIIGRPGSVEVVKAHEEIRSTLKNAARIVMMQCKESRERSIVMSKIEEAMFWANAAIARHHPDNQ